MKLFISDYIGLFLLLLHPRKILRGSHRHKVPQGDTWKVFNAMP
jgi:hypothetical protein